MISDLSLLLQVDGTSRQEGGVSQMLFKPSSIIDEVSQFMTLEEGDIIMTGTPEGVGPVGEGEHFVGQVRQSDKLLLEVEWIAS